MHFFTENEVNPMNDLIEIQVEDYAAKN